MKCRALVSIIITLGFSASVYAINESPSLNSSRSNKEITTINQATLVATDKKESTIGIKSELDEAKIPLAIEKSESKVTDTGYGMKLIIAMFVIGVTGIVAILFLKKFSRPRGINPSTQIKILTQHWLGPKKSLAIIRVAGESVLIGITDTNINMIKSLSLLDEDIPEALSTPQFDVALQNVLAKVKDLRPI